MRLVFAFVASVAFFALFWCSCLFCETVAFTAHSIEESNKEIKTNIFLNKDMESSDHWWVFACVASVAYFACFAFFC